MAFNNVQSYVRIDSWPNSFVARTMKETERVSFLSSLGGLDSSLPNPRLHANHPSLDLSCVQNVHYVRSSQPVLLYEPERY